MLICQLEHMVGSLNRCFLKSSVVARGEKDLKRGYLLYYEILTISRNPQALTLPSVLREIEINRMVKQNKNIGEAWSCVITNVVVHLIFLENNVTSGAPTCQPIKSSVTHYNPETAGDTSNKGGAL